MINELISKLSDNPRIFNFLRKIIESNFQAQRQVILRYFSDKGEAPVLDIGCGTGEFSLFFKSNSYTGIDVKKKYTDFARKNYQGNFLVANAIKLPFINRSFPKVLMIGVLHHLSDSDCFKVLKEAKRILSQDGQMLIMEDIKTLADGFLTKLIHHLDKGKRIRPKEIYRKWLTDDFKIKKDFQIKSGLCPYQVFLLENKR